MTQSSPPPRPKSRRNTRRPRQLQLGLRQRPSWGGARAGAGRKKTGKAGVSHLERPSFGERQALHVTLRVKKDVWNLRAKRCYRHIRAAFAAARERGQDGINGLCVRMGLSPKLLTA